MVEQFLRRRRIVVDGLNELPGVRCLEPAGAFYAFPNVEGVPLPADVLAQRLLDEAGVATLAGSAFGRFGEGHLRISYANSEANLREALARMAAFLAERVESSRRTSTTSVRGPWTPSTRSSSMSEVAEGPEMNVSGRRSRTASLQARDRLGDELDDPALLDEADVQVGDERDRAAALVRRAR